ncbi:MAG TPA: hypothetical protein VGD37_07110, partial [Kofleriaceae bacterium]|jgi:hypothetical protein
MRLALLTCALLGCAYQPGSFRYPPQDFPGQRLTVGCLDLAVERRADLATGLARGPVLAYQFANRCDHPAMIDLAAVAVVRRDAQGVDVALRPYDPHAELHPVALDGRNVGTEALVYVAVRSAGWPAASPADQLSDGTVDQDADPSIPQVCVDAATLAHQGGPQWLCFGAPARVVIGRAP